MSISSCKDIASAYGYRTNITICYTIINFNPSISIISRLVNTTLGLPHGIDIYSLPVGTELFESELTSYDSLGTLIEKFNDFARQKGFQELNKRIIDIRDAFAHGRVSSPSISDHLRLIKFSRPKNGKVEITFNEVLTEKWFKDNIKLVHDSIVFVHDCPCT